MADRVFDIYIIYSSRMPVLSYPDKQKNYSTSNISMFLLFIFVFSKNEYSVEFYR